MLNHDKLYSLRAKQPKQAKWVSVLAVSLAVSFVWVAGVRAEALLLGNPEHGALLHDEKCTACHIARLGGDGNGIYTRDDRRIQTIEGLMQQVQFCNANTGSGFSPDQLDDIVAYLNKKFYHFDD